MTVIHVFPSPEPRQLSSEPPPDSMNSKTDGMCVHARGHETRKGITGQRRRHSGGEERLMEHKGQEAKVGTTLERKPARKRALETGEGNRRGD